MISAADIPFNASDAMFIDNMGMATGYSRQLEDVDLYVRDGIVSGIKVADEFRDRQIPRDTNFSEVFVPKHDINVFCLDIYPGSEDIQIYKNILQSVYSGDAILESVDKHPSDKGFIVMLVVNNARMVFRKKEYGEDFPEIKYEK